MFPSRTQFIALPRRERIFTAFMIFSFLFTVAFAFLQTVTSFEVTLDPIQLIYLGMVASALIQIFKWAAEIKGTEIDPRYVRAVVFAVSMGMGWYWIRPEVPADADFMELALALIAGLAVVGGFAKLIYDAILERVLKGLDIIFQFERFKFEPNSKPPEEPPDLAPMIQ